jgi:hypothetical protein
MLNKFDLLLLKSIKKESKTTKNVEEKSSTLPSIKFFLVRELFTSSINGKNGTRSERKFPLGLSR